MTLRAKVRKDQILDAWAVDLWQVTDHGRYLFGQKHFLSWEHALYWALFRLSLVDPHG